MDGLLKITHVVEVVELAPLPVQRPRTLVGPIMKVKLIRIRFDEIHITSLSSIVRYNNVISKEIFRALLFFLFVILCLFTSENMALLGLET